MNRIILRTLSLILITSLFINAFSTPLPVPNNLVAFNSTEGKRLLAKNINENYLNLSMQFLTQKNQAYCGIASMTMILNALRIKGPQDPVYTPYNPITQDNFFTPSIKSIITQKTVSSVGLTLDQAASILASYSIKVYAIHSNQINLSSMRSLLKYSLSKHQTYVIINFFRPKLNEEGAGHFSPLAAYDSKTDRFLLLDVARYKYPPVWVKSKDLWQAINTIDDTSKRNRGILIISR